MLCPSQAVVSPVRHCTGPQHLQPFTGSKSSCQQFLLPPPPWSSCVHFNTFANLLWRLCFSFFILQLCFTSEFAAYGTYGYAMYYFFVLFSASSTWPQLWDPPCQACSPSLLTQPVPLMPKRPWPHHTCPIFLCTTSQSYSDELEQYHCNNKQRKSN